MRVNAHHLCPYVLTSKTACGLDYSMVGAQQPSKPCPWKKRRHDLDAKTELMEWLSKYATGKVQAGKENDYVRTHGSLGWCYMWSIPPEHQKELFKMYEAALRKKEKVCIDEKLTQTFHMFMDFDIKFSTSTDLFDPISVVDQTGRTVVGYRWVKEVRGYAECAARTLSGFFPSLLEERDPPEVEELGYYDEKLGEWVGTLPGFGRLSCVATVGPVGKVSGENGKKECWKVGMHLNWVGCIGVDPEKAIEIRDSTVVNLEIEYGPRNERQGENDWDSVVDKQVYGNDKGKKKTASGTGGVRMVGSCKPVFCGKCSGKQQKVKNHADCDTCGRRGKVIVEKIYYPEWVLDGDGKDDSRLTYLLDPMNRLDLIMACSVKTSVSKPSPEFVSQKKEVVLSETEEDLKKIPSSMRVGKNTKRTVVQSGYCDSKQVYAANSAEALAVIEIIREIDTAYERVIINAFLRLNKTSYSMNVRGPNSCYCMNVKREHGQNIYFVVSTAGIVQKCFCKKGSCDKYQSAPTPIPFELKSLLFGDLRDRKSVNLPRRSIEQDTHMLDEYGLLYQAEQLRILDLKARKYFGAQCRENNIRNLKANRDNKARPHVSREFGRPQTGGAQQRKRTSFDKKDAPPKRKKNEEKRRRIEPDPDTGIVWGRNVRSI